MFRNGKWCRQSTWHGRTTTEECKAHFYHWNGRVPCTGEQVCSLCGKPKNSGSKRQNPTGLVSRWETRGKRHWYELYNHGSGFYYHGDGCGGNLGRMSLKQALSHIEKMVTEARAIDGINYKQVFLRAKNPILESIVYGVGLGTGLAVAGAGTRKLFGLKNPQQRNPVEKTKVIFRKWSPSEGGDIIAIFPEDPGTMDPYTCNSYEHIGQHGACDPVGLIQRTSLAKPKEYKGLKEELTSMGYKLEIIQRYRQSFLESRRKQLRAYKKPRKGGR